MKEELGYIDDIGVGRDRPLELLGVTIFPVSDSWLTISKFYEDSKLKRLFFIKQLGIYKTKDASKYKIGNVVSVKIDNNEITELKIIGHLNPIEYLYPVFGWLILVFLILFLLRPHVIIHWIIHNWRNG